MQSSIQASSFLLSKTTVQLDVSSESQTFADLLRTADIPFVQNNSAFHIEINHYNAVLAAVDSAQRISIRKLPAFVLRAITNPPAPPPLAPSDLSLALEHNLHRYQQEDATAALRRGGRVMIVGESGVGKRVEAMYLATRYLPDGSVLVVCSSVLAEHWVWLLRHWLGTAVSVAQTDGTDMTDRQFSVVSFGGLTNILATISRRPFATVIVDGYHHIVNPEQKQAKEMLSLARTCKNVILLAQSFPMANAFKTYNAFAMLVRDFAAVDEFAKRYCDRVTFEKSTRKYCGVRYATELDTLLHTVAVFRRRSGVETEIMSRSRDVVSLGQPHYDAFERRFADIITCSDHKLSVVEMYRLVCASKVPLISAYVEEVLSRGTKAVMLIGHHADLFKGLETFLRRKRLTAIRLGTQTADVETVSETLRTHSDTPKIFLVPFEAVPSAVRISLDAHCLIVELSFLVGTIPNIEHELRRAGLRVQVLLSSDLLEQYLWRFIKEQVGVRFSCSAPTTLVDNSVFINGIEGVMSQYAITSPDRKHLLPTSIPAKRGVPNHPSQDHHENLSFPSFVMFKR